MSWDNNTFHLIRFLLHNDGNAHARMHVAWNYNNMWIISLPRLGWYIRNITQVLSLFRQDCKWEVGGPAFCKKDDFHPAPKVGDVPSLSLSLSPLLTNGRENSWQGTLCRCEPLLTMTSDILCFPESQPGCDVDLADFNFSLAFSLSPLLTLSLPLSLICVWPWPLH